METENIYRIIPVLPPIKVIRYSIPVMQGSINAGYNYSNYNGPDKFDLASSEILRLNVYGSINANQLTDFKKSQLYGLIFNFVDTSKIDKYLRIPYDSSRLDGTDLYYSHARFLPDVVPCNEPRLFYLYNPDTSNITYNNKGQITNTTSAIITTLTGRSSNTTSANTYVSAFNGFPSQTRFTNQTLITAVSANSTGSTTASIVLTSAGFMSIMTVDYGRVAIPIFKHN
jgi:hypothetical protein